MIGQDGIMARQGRSIAVSSAQTLLQLDSPLKGAASNEQNLMLYPFFDLDRKAVKQKAVFQKGKTRIEIKAIAGQGIATIYDRDLIIYAASLVKQQIEADPAVEPRKELIFAAHDFFGKACRDKSMRSYEKIEAAVERLKGTLIKTNIETGGRGATGWFNWLGEGTAVVYEIDEESSERRMRYVKIVLCDWLMRAIREDGRMFAVPPTYFDLTPVERRLYDLGRVNCDGSQVWRTTLGDLHLAVGANVAVPRFKAQVKAANIPEYDVLITDEFAPSMDPEKTGKGGRPSVAQQVVILSPKGALVTAQEDPVHPTPTLPCAAATSPAPAPVRRRWPSRKPKEETDALTLPGI